MMKNNLITLLLVCFSCSLFSQTSSANYTVTFTSNWSEATHPHPSNNFPSNAHWSKLVGASHNENVIFLEMGQHASPGVEDVAELGSNSIFFSEINTAISNGFSNLLIDGDDLPTSLGTISFFLGSAITAWLIGEKVYHNWIIKEAVRPVTDQPLFFLALVALIIGVQLFLAGFLGELLSTQRRTKDYWVNEKIGL